MSKRFNRRLEILKAKVRRGRAILAFSKAMQDADLQYIHHHAEHYQPFTLNMQDAWYEYMNASLDLYDLTHVEL